MKRPYRLAAKLFAALVALNLGILAIWAGGNAITPASVWDTTVLHFMGVFTWVAIVTLAVLAFLMFLIVSEDGAP